MIDFELDTNQVAELKRGFNAIKALEEEKKSFGEDIKEEKIAISKSTGLKLKEINTIFKIIKHRQSGVKAEDYTDIVDKIESHDMYLND